MKKYLKAQNTFNLKGRKVFMVNNQIQCQYCFWLQYTEIVRKDGLIIGFTVTDWQHSLDCPQK